MFVYEHTQIKSGDGMKNSVIVNNIFETEHYVFHFKKGSLAEQDILDIAETQENCYNEITQLLKIYPNFKINYYLVNTPEEVGLIYAQINNCNDIEPCNGFNIAPDTIYAVYNKNIKCIGMHEDTHIISYTITRPKSAFLREGLAMYMDKMWKGAKNEKCVIDILKQGCKINIFDFFNNEYFFNFDCNISYPLAGVFVKYIIGHYGIKKFLDELYYSQKNYISQLKTIFEFKNNIFLKEINILS